MPPASNRSDSSDRADWHAEQAPGRRYPNTRRTSQFVPMDDGVKVAIDLYLPDPLPHPLAPEKCPAVLMQTPYFRALEVRSWVPGRLRRIIGGDDKLAVALTGFGYAVVVMDLRGSGASYGRRRAVMMADSVPDGVQVLDWIVQQPWSNGRVGATGISAIGLTALWLATGRHPALQAIAPRFTVFDMFAGPHPGGLTPERFFVSVEGIMKALDSNRPYGLARSALGRAALRTIMRGIRPVDDDTDGSLLRAAVSEHRGNEYLSEDINTAEYRDAPMTSPTADGTLDTQSPYRFADQIRDAHIPILSYTGWLDAAFSREMINLHNTIRTPGSRLVIGPWGHGGGWYCSPTVTTKRAAEFDHAAEIAMFFDAHLRREGVVDASPAVRYFTMGQERWQAAVSWPPPGATPRTWWLGPRRSLPAAPPTEPGDVEQEVDFNTGTGPHSRFGRQLSGPRSTVSYADRARLDEGLPHFDSDPLDQDTEVTGHPLATIWVTSSRPDVTVAVYLEDVAPDGQVRMVTEGYLRAIHRKVSDDASPYWSPGPFRTYTRVDAEEMPLGKPVCLEWDLLPVSWLFDAAHRIRVTVAGTDHNFRRIPAEGPVSLRILTGGDCASRIQLPTMPADTARG